MNRCFRPLLHWCVTSWTAELSGITGANETTGSEVSDFDLLEALSPPACQALNCCDMRGKGEPGVEVFRSRQVFQSLTSLQCLPPGEYCNKPCFKRSQFLFFPSYRGILMGQWWEISRPSRGIRCDRTHGCTQTHKCTLLWFVYSVGCSALILCSKLNFHSFMVSQAVLLFLPLWHIQRDSRRPEKHRGLHQLLQRRRATLSLMPSSGQSLLAGWLAGGGWVDTVPCCVSLMHIL